MFNFFRPRMSAKQVDVNEPRIRAIANIIEALYGSREVPTFAKVVTANVVNGAFAVSTPNVVSAILIPKPLSASPLPKKEHIQCITNS